MFIAHSRLLDLPVSTAQARLSEVIGDGGVWRSAQTAYASGIERVIRVGPFGDVPVMAKLVRVQLLDPRHRDDGATLAMRWEAIGTAGTLFPVLDADLSLTSEGEHATRLAVVGTYRPPFAWLGAGLDRALLHRVATATIRALLRDLARVLTAPPAVASCGADTQELEAGGVLRA
jgi:hypothetical protein